MANGTKLKTTLSFQPGWAHLTNAVFTTKTIVLIMESYKYLEQDQMSIDAVV